MTTWLRRQIGLRRSLASFTPLTDMHGREPVPPNPAYIWHDGGGQDWYLTADELIRQLAVAGVLVAGEPPGDLIPFMAARDGRDVADRCVAERLILDEHAAVPDHGRFSDDEECGADCGCSGRDRVCRSCRTYAGDPVPAPCRTVRLLGSAYRHRPGFDPSWLPT